VFSPTHSFGVDSSRVLEEIMDATPRSPEVQDLLDRLSRSVADKKLEDASNLVTELAAKLGEDDAEVIRARTLLDFLGGENEGDREGPGAAQPRRTPRERALRLRQLADKDGLRAALVRDQRGLCCYCMTRVEATGTRMKIEHWRCQSRNADLELAYSNLLAACLGGMVSPRRLSTATRARESRT
jgi:hypothetical protein